MEINQIYSEIIREHSIYSDHKHDLENKTDTQLGVNPSCGDEITLNLNVQGDIIVDASYQGIGCAISQASTSMMIDIIKGKSLTEAKKDVDIFLKMIQGEDLSEEEMENLQDAAALESIKQLPARVKCAVLAWKTLDKIIADKNK